MYFPQVIVLVVMFDVRVLHKARLYFVAISLCGAKGEEASSVLHVNFLRGGRVPGIPLPSGTVGMENAKDLLSPLYS